MGSAANAHTASMDLVTRCGSVLHVVSVGVPA